MARVDKRKQILRRLRVLMIVGMAVIVSPVVLVPLYALVNPISMPMLGRYLTLQRVERVWRPLDEISDRLKASVVMSEDGQFCRHWGVDVGALREEFDVWRSGRSPRGASTISMQVARNLFLWNGRSYVRKVLELPLAVYLDVILPKRRIMEIYLNIAEWGPEGEFGIEAGTERAFGTNGENFTWERAGLMAAALPNPHVRNPARPSYGMRRIAGIVARRARASGEYIGCL